LTVYVRECERICVAYMRAIAPFVLYSRKKKVFIYNKRAIVGKHIKMKEKLFVSWKLVQVKHKSNKTSC